MRSRIHKRTRALRTFAYNAVSIHDDRAYRHVTLPQRRLSQLEAAPHVSFMRDARTVCTVVHHDRYPRVQEEMSSDRASSLEWRALGFITELL
jgi:hypothetical protein